MEVSKLARHGGNQGGRPKGSKNQSTIDKELIRQRVRELVAAQVDSLVEAQLANARGLKYLVVRDKKTGKFERVAEAMAKIKLKEGEELVEVWEKDPSVQAFTDLMNRTIDKPIEQVIADLNVSHERYGWLDKPPDQ